MMSADSFVAIPVAIAVALAAVAASIGDMKGLAAGGLAAGGLGVLAFFVKDGLKKAVEHLQTMQQVVCSLTSTKLHYYTNSGTMLS